MIETNNCSVKYIDVRVGDTMVQTIDHNRKCVTLMLKVNFPASEVNEHNDEVGDRISKIMDYLRFEGFFPENEELKDAKYQIKFHFFHDVNRNV